MHYVEGYGHREIARMLGLSIGTSKSQLSRARVQLRQLLRAGEAAPRRAEVGGSPLCLFRAGLATKPPSRLRFPGSSG